MPQTINGITRKKMGIYQSAKPSSVTSAYIKHVYIMFMTQRIHFLSNYYFLNILFNYLFLPV